MAEDWTDVTEAVELASSAYIKMLKAREDERAGTKALALVEDAWLEAVENRAQVLARHWIPEDGMMGEFKRVGPTLQRYYAAKFEAEKEAKKK